MRWLTAFLTLCGVEARAGEDLDVVLKRLARVNTFAFGGIGFAGVTSKGESDFKFVLSQSAPVALAAFEKLYASGNPQAKAYALAGMKKLNPNRSREFLAIAEASTDQVAVMRGCIMAHESLRELAKQIDSGQFRF